MEEDLKGNMGLQYTIATLEKLFLEADYPSHKRVPKLPESPRNLGISRADSWPWTGSRLRPRMCAVARSAPGAPPADGGSGQTTTLVSAFKVS